MTELLYNPDCWDWPIERRESHLRIVAPLYRVGSNKFKENTMKLGKVIRHARTKRDMTLKELASLTGVSVSYLSLLERDKRDPSVSTVCDIAKGLSVAPFLLIAGAEILDGDELEEIVGVEVVEKLARELMSSLGRGNNG